MLKLIYHRFIPVTSYNKVNTFAWPDSKIMFLCMDFRSKNSAFISKLVIRIMCSRQSWSNKGKGCWLECMVTFVEFLKNICNSLYPWLFNAHSKVCNYFPVNAQLQYALVLGLTTVYHFTKLLVQSFFQSTTANELKL